jgi:hypothetical protein
MQIRLRGLFAMVPRVRNQHTRILPNADRDSDMPVQKEWDEMP